MSTNEEKLNELQNEDFKNWHFSFWLVKQYMKARKAHYRVLGVDVHDTLRDKLRKSLIEKVQAKDVELMEYAFLTTDQDARVMTLSSDETDFKLINEQIAKGLKAKKAEKYEDLLNSWAYVVELKHGDKKLLGLKKINKLNKVKTKKNLKPLLFQNKMLVDMGEKEMFTIDTRLDCFVYEGIVFIVNKSEFEQALNFREGMINHRDVILGEFRELKLFRDCGPIGAKVGTDLTMLRRLATIRNLAYYRDPHFMAGLIRVNNEDQLGLVILDGQIDINEDQVDTLLVLLMNARLKSVINAEVFHVPALGKKMS